MKRICLLIALLLSIGFATNSSQTVTTKNWINQPVICLDSATGVPVTADSAHIHVYFGNADSACYSARITTIPSEWIDRIVYAGATTFHFLDEVKDIDADSGVGRYMVNVVLWKDRTPTDNVFFFEITNTTGDSLVEIYMTPGGDNSNDGLTWETAVKHISIAEALCTGGNSYIVHVAPGTYTSQRCTVDVAKDIEFRGAGIGSSILQGGVWNEPVFYVNMTSGQFKISGFTIDADVDSATGIWVNDADYFTIKDCLIRDSYYGFYGATGAQFGLIEDCRFFGNNLDHINFYGADACIVRNCVLDSLVNSGADGIMVNESDYMGIYNNYIITHVGNSSIRFGGISDKPTRNFIANNFCWAAKDSSARFQDNAYQWASFLSRSYQNAAFANWGRNQMDLDSGYTVQEQVYIIKAKQDTLIDTTNAILDTLQAGFGSQTNQSNLDEAISGIDDDPWDAAIRSLTQTGLDADTSFTNLQTVAQGIKDKTDNLPSDPADQSLIMAEVQGLDGWNPITDNDSLTVDLSDMWGIRGDLSTFDPTSDPVARVTYVDSVDTVITQPAGGSGSDTTAIKAMHDNRGTSTFDASTDSTLQTQAIPVFVTGIVADYIVSISKLLGSVDGDSTVFYHTGAIMDSIRVFRSGQCRSTLYLYPFGEANKDYAKFVEW